MSRVLEVADNVFLVAGTEVNWVVLRDGSDITLIDSGYPRDVPAVEASLRELGGRPEDVRAVLLTHAHIDHMGAVNHFHERHGTPLYTDPIEVRHARREYLEQAGPLDVAKNLWRPGVLPWTVRIMRVGAARKMSAPHAQPFPTDRALDLPGRPVPVPTHGHTSGHTAYHLPQAGVVITGDELITAHAVSRVDGPQLISPVFSHLDFDPAAVLAPLAELDADVVLPGHGPVHRGPVAAAVATALERASSS
jgi:glyoxylase-like metal-dependent hydrolase (beta-lactamase superfamily II)